MGGLLAADIALVFRHRILGIVNFDVPFLGMHPGIVKAGLGSLFSPAPAPQDAIVPDVESGKKPSRMGTLFSSKPSDPNYNPSFSNDVQLPVRKGWENTLHWLSKHYNDGLRQATKGLVKSHFEFGSAMADYRELKERYAKVRALEEDDESKRAISMPNVRSVPRIRFVNYYTATTGRPKKPKSPKSPKSPSLSRPASRQFQHRDSDYDTPTATFSIDNQETPSQDSDSRTSIASSRPEMTFIHPEPMHDSPRISIEVQEYCGDEVVSVQPQEPLSATSPVKASVLDAETLPQLTDIPPIPTEPQFVDLMQFTDKAHRKAAEKEHEKALKEYQKAVKARNKAINERIRMEEKWEKQQKHMSTEDKQRRVEAEQRQKEAREREAESVQRQKEADERRADTTKPLAEPSIQEETPEVTSPTGLEEDIGAMQLGSSRTGQEDSNTPPTHYNFSPSAIMSQVSPDQASITDSGYTMSTMNSQSSHPAATNTGGDNSTKPKKLKTFCMLPPKDVQGNKDPAWIRVVMEGMDEVSAHTSLFFVNETYERLVGDVGAKIEDWVREADSERLVREMEGLN